jgi:hypothetical protein
MGLGLIFLDFQMDDLEQGWPTQIGIWAANWKICQKYWLFGPYYNKKLRKYTQNREKSLILNWSLGRKNFILGRGLATFDLEGHLMESQLYMNIDKPKCSKTNNFILTRLRHIRMWNKL